MNIMNAAIRMTATMIITLMSPVCGARTCRGVGVRDADGRIAVPKNKAVNNDTIIVFEAAQRRFPPCPDFPDYIIPHSCHSVNKLLIKCYKKLNSFIIPAEMAAVSCFCRIGAL